MSHDPAQRDLTGPPINTKVLVDRRLTEAQRANARNSEVGNVLRFSRAYRRLGVDRNEYLTVVAVDASTNGLRLAGRTDKTLSCNAAQLGQRVEVFSAPEARTLQVGDLVRWTRNERAHGRINNQMAEVVSIGDDQQSAVVVVNGRRQELDLTHPHQHWDHAYASTVHAQQGATAELVIAHVDTEAGHSFGKESWYITLTRGKGPIRVFTNNIDSIELAVDRPQEQPSALDATERPPDRNWRSLDLTQDSTSETQASARPRFVFGKHPVAQGRPPLRCSQPP